MTYFNVSAFNVNGLFGKSDQVDSLLFPDGPADILFVSEAGILQTHHISSPRLVHLIRAPPNSHRSKSWALFCSSRIRPHINLIPIPNGIPAIAVRLRTTYIIGIYFSPSWDSNRCVTTLETIIGLAPQASPLILGGDFNMRLGATTGDSRTSRLHLHRALQGHSLARHPTQHIPLHTCYTRSSASTIDHIYSRHLPLSTLQVIDTESGSDHLAVSANFPLPEITLQEVSVDKRLNTRKLQDRLQHQAFHTTAADLIANIGNKLVAYAHPLVHRSKHDSQRSVNRAWETIRDTLLLAAENTIGYQHHFQEKKRWCNSPEYRLAKRAREKAFRLLRSTPHDDETYEERWRSFRTCRKAAKIALQQAFEKMKQDRWRKWQGMPSAELLKEISRMYRTRSTSSNTTSLGADGEALESYATYYENAFSNNLMQPQDAFQVQPWRYEDIPPPPLRTATWARTIDTAIKNLAKGKASGEDGLPAEIFQAAGTAVVKALQALFTIIVRAGLIPEQWKVVRLIPLYKKGDKGDISNYRPISITPVARKIFEQCLLQEISKKIDPLSVEQGGFREHWSTLDQAAALDLLIQREQSNGIYAVLLDIQKAYDSVALPLLWHRLAAKGMESATINILVQLFEGCKSRIVVAGAKSREIQHTAGVLQGSSLSPLLYAAYIDDIASRVNRASLGFNIAGRHFGILMYADDMVVVARTHQDTQQILDIVNQHAVDMRYRFNVGKCEHLIPANQSQPPSLKINNQDIPQRTQVTYLGFPFSTDGLDTDALVDKAINKVKQRLSIFRAIGVRKQAAPPSVSIKIIKTFLRPILEYGLAIALPTPKLRHKLDQTLHRCLTTALGVQHTTSFAALQMLCRQPAAQTRWKWLAANYAARASRATPQQTAFFVWLESTTRSSNTGTPPLAVALRRARGWQQVQQAQLMPQRLKIRQTWAFQDWETKTSNPNKPIQHAWITPDDNHSASRLLVCTMVTARQHRLLLLWRVGRFTGDPPPCTMCNTPDTRATRAHLEECRRWPVLFATDIPLRIGQTHLDIALNIYEETGDKTLITRAAVELETIWRLLYVQHTRQIA